MSEQFVKLHTWMTHSGLTPSEMIILAVIHSYTESGGSYFGGIAVLEEWTGCSERTIRAALKHLVEGEWVLTKKESKGRKATEYISNPANFAAQPCNLCRVNPANFAPNKNNNKNIINTPPISPPKGGEAHADAKTDKKRRRRNRAMNYMQGKTYTEDELRKMGISLGEEFYDDTIETMREELRT